MSGIRETKAKERQRQMVEAMMDYEWLTPTQIGMRIGYEKHNASGKVQDQLKRLVIQGLVEKSLARGYRLKKDVPLPKEVSLPFNNDQQIRSPA